MIGVVGIGVGPPEGLVNIAIVITSAVTAAIARIAQNLGSLRRCSVLSTI